jgi:hypothetical protein
MCLFRLLVHPFLDRPHRVVRKQQAKGKKFNLVRGGKSVHSLLGSSPVVSVSFRIRITGRPFPTRTFRPGHRNFPHGSWRVDCRCGSDRIVRFHAAILRVGRLR